MRRKQNFLNPWLLLVGALLILSPGVLPADELTIVVVEKSDDEDQDTNHTGNCEGLPANSTKVDAGSLQEAVDDIKEKVGKDDCVKNLHFRGHGSPGNQSVGDGVEHEAGKRINGNKAEWEAKLKSIKFCKDATIHLWGCNVGAGEKGACKLKEIADCTGTTVRGSVNTVYAGKQEDYDGPICEAKSGEDKPECQEPTDEKAKKKKKAKSEDVGCVSTADAVAFGVGDGYLNTEDVGCDGIPGTFDEGEGDGLLNTVNNDGEGGCYYGPGEDLGCDNKPGTFDAGEGDGKLNTEDHDGDRELTVYAVSIPQETQLPNKPSKH